MTLLPARAGGSRPQLVLMIGNGFSVDLVYHLGIRDRVITNPLIPQPETTLYTPIESDDPFPEQPLWNRNLFPELWAEWERKPPDKDFSWLCEHLASRGPINFSTEPRTYSFFCREAGYQLRAYLWNLFRVQDNIHWAALTSKTYHGWAWGKVLAQLVSFYRVTVISFNYDVNIERFLEQGLACRVIAPGDRCMEALTTADPFSVLVLKPHGSIGLYSAADLYLGGVKWLHFNIAWNCSAFEFAQPVTRFPLDRYPSLPDIVPPGHPGDHLANPQMDVTQAIKWVMERCDAFVLCGLSAARPDTDEVRSYLSSLRPETPAFHIDMNPSVPAAGLLQKVTTRYKFMRPAEIGSLPLDVYMALR